MIHDLVAIAVNDSPDVQDSAAITPSIYGVR
jgi:hypothetical protein